MPQFINYKDNDKGEHEVMFYHTVPSKAGTPDFEHKGFVKLKDVRNAKRHNGAEDPDLLEIACPMPGCGSVAFVPLLGGEEAQRLHAKVRFHRDKKAKNITEAIASVIADVKAKGGIPRLEEEGQG